MLILQTPLISRCLIEQHIHFNKLYINQYFLYLTFYKKNSIYIPPQELEVRAILSFVVQQVFCWRHDSLLIKFEGGEKYCTHCGTSDYSAACKYNKELIETEYTFREREVLLKEKETDAKLKIKRGRREGKRGRREGEWIPIFYIRYLSFNFSV